MNNFVSQDTLISIAKDRRIDEASRSDAISFLSDFPDEKTLQVLIKLALQKGEDFYIYEKIGESLGFVIARLGKEYMMKLSFLPEIVKGEALAIIKNERPEWNIS